MRTLIVSFFLLPTFLFANPFPHFNPATVQSFEGTVSSVQNFGNVTKPTPHKQIILRTQQGEIVVDIGPEWFINQQGINLYPGAKVKIIGSLIKLNGTRYVIASSLTIDDMTYKLREENGLPVWKR